MPSGLDRRKLSLVTFRLVLGVQEEREGTNLCWHQEKVQCLSPSLESERTVLQVMLSFPSAKMSVPAKSLLSLETAAEGPLLFLCSFRDAW